MVTSTNSPSCPVIRFYDPKLDSRDSLGRQLPDILEWSNSKLESCHDYIQWLFPLPERSPVTPSAPIITRTTFNAFHARPELCTELREPLRRMCQFYGFDFHVDEHQKNPHIEKLGDGGFERRARNWVMRFNHNHLRITRIIRSLRVLGLEEEAKVFFEAVEGVHNDTKKISDRSLMYWRRAMDRPLYLAPEDEEDEGEGKDFLYEYEEKKEKVKERADQETQAEESAP